MFEGLIGAEMPLAIRLCLAFLIVVGLVSAAAWAFSRSGRGRSAGASGRDMRLAIIDSASFEGSRRLILIRRDDVEHLLMIGGPTDVVVETNILHVAGAPFELPVTRSPAAAERQPRATPQADKGSRPLPPEQTAMPHPALQFKPSVPPPFRPLSQEPVAGQFQAKAETPTQLKRDTLAALANELSTRAPAPPKGLAKVARPQLVEPHPELRFEPSAKLQSELGTEPRSESDPELRPEYFVESQAEPPMEAPQSAQPVAVETAPTADEELAELARLLESKLRKPNVPANANPSSVPASVVPSQERARPAAAAPSLPSPVRARPPSEPQLPRADAEISTPDDNLEQQLASLLGRAIKD
jgi:flagellar protein FliO/FliZ